MHEVDALILVGGGLVLLSILAGTLSSRIGAPLLLVFLLLGMLAGEDGPGGLLFSDFDLAYLIGTLALAVILFDGGLRTPFEAIRLAVWPALSLATLGVLVTAAIVAAGAVLLLDFSWPPALLLGAIVSSTDAAAVFLLLHQRGTELRRRLAATLEVESGANDPMAVFLTVGLAELIRAGGGDPWVLAGHFAQAMALGGGVGLIAGFALAQAISRLELAPGLYPVFCAAAALLTFGAAQSVGASGFLAVYLAGLVAGNQRLRARQLIRRFHDGAAWTAQIVMFVMLGLLVTPRALVPELGTGVVIALLLIFIARPLAALIALAPFRFSLEERLFVAWVGLRGAVSIYLAIVPVLWGLLDGQHYFQIAFVVVLSSLLLQGWSVPIVARWLGVEAIAAPEPDNADRVGLDLPAQLDRDFMVYHLREGAPALTRELVQLRLPHRARILAVLRDNAAVPLTAVGQLQAEDYVLTLAPPEQVFQLDRLFTPEARRWFGAEASLGLGFPFAADRSLGEVTAALGLEGIEADPTESLERYVTARLGERPLLGEHVPFGPVDLRVAGLADGRVARIVVDLEPRWGGRRLLGPLRRALRWLRR